MGLSTMAHDLQVHGNMKKQDKPLLSETLDFPGLEANA